MKNSNLMRKKARLLVISIHLHTLNKIALNNGFAPKKVT